MLTNAEVTIFKRVRKGREDIFVPHTFKAHFEDCRGMNIMASGRALTDIDNIKVFIPLSELKDFKCEKNDYILRDKVLGEYNSLEEIKKQYNDVFIITSADTFDYGSEHLKHLRIGAK